MQTRNDEPSNVSSERNESDREESEREKEESERDTRAGWLCEGGSNLELQGH